LSRRPVEDTRAVALSVLSLGGPYQDKQIAIMDPPAAISSVPRSRIIVVMGAKFGSERRRIADSLVYGFDGRSE